MKYVRLYSDEGGDSHFEDVEVGFESVDFAPPAPPLDLSSSTPASQLPGDSSFAFLPVNLKSLRATVKHAFCCQGMLCLSRIPLVKVTKARLQAKRIQ